MPAGSDEKFIALLVRWNPLLRQLGKGLLKLQLQEEQLVQRRLSMAQGQQQLLELQLRLTQSRLTTSENQRREEATPSG